MARLPTPGGDAGNWGTILNDYLSVSLSSNGTIQPAALQAAGALTGVSISSPSNNQILAYSNGQWINQTPSSGVQLDHTASDIQPLGTQAAGATNLAADAGHVHPTTGVVLTTTNQTVAGNKTFTGNTIVEGNGASPFVVSTDGTTTSNGAFVINESASPPWFGIYAPSNNLYFGVSTALPGPSGTSMLGGYFHGLGVSGSTANSGTAIFGVLNSSQSLSGLGNVALTVYDNNEVVTFNNTLDDGSGNTTVVGTLKSSKAVTGGVSALTFATTIAINASLGNIFAVTLTTSAGTLGAPTNPTDGQTMRIRVIQGGSGSNTLAYNAIYDFGVAGAPTLSTAVNKVDILAFEYVASLTKWCYLGSGLGF